MLNKDFWNNKTIFLTGHTGFKGGWLAHWLHELGSTVHGYSLAPPSQPNFFIETNAVDRLASSSYGDLRDFDSLVMALNKAKPDIIFHMAAQSLVRESYVSPIETFSTNIMGTVNLLEASRKVASVKAIINVTTDKCYENMEWHWPYRENDRLGGYDPYSASKACAEIVSSAYRKSFMQELSIHLATVRAGNVIGGGDWATDRLIPDFLRAYDAGKEMRIRFPDAIRPWQHVLEPLSGYLRLAECLYLGGEGFSNSWNFGPDGKSAKPVKYIIETLSKLVPDFKYEIESDAQPHEAGLLMLDSSKAKAYLDWEPSWDLDLALKKTMEWHLAWRNNEDMAEVTSRQIVEYCAL